MIDKYVVVELSRENNQERRRNIPFFNKGSILPAKSLSFHWNLWVFVVLPVARIPRLGISTCWSRCKLCHWPLSSSMMMMMLPTLFLLNFRAKITFHYTLLRLHLLLSSWFWSSGGKWIVKKGFFFDMFVCNNHITYIYIESLSSTCFENCLLPDLSLRAPLPGQEPMAGPSSSERQTQEGDNS